MDHIITRRFLLAGSGCVILLSACSTTALSPVETGNVADMTDAALPIVNTVRRKRGLSSLSNDPVAADAARDQAIRMARYGQMRHDLGSDKSFLARMKRMQVPLPAAENIATGQRDTEGAVLAWINSKKHLENMIGNYTGLGVVVARSSKDGRPYWAMVLSNAPSPRFAFGGL